jgi:hypothetical protein
MKSTIIILVVFFITGCNTKRGWYPFKLPSKHENEVFKTIRNESDILLKNRYIKSVIFKNLIKNKKGILERETFIIGHKTTYIFENLKKLSIKTKIKLKKLFKNLLFIYKIRKIHIQSIMFKLNQHIEGIRTYYEGKLLFNFSLIGRKMTPEKLKIFLHQVDSDYTEYEKTTLKDRKYLVVLMLTHILNLN